MIEKEKKMKKDNGLMNCRFLTSDKCHKEFPNFSGASIKMGKNSEMTCDAIGNQRQAEAVATLTQGEIKNVFLIDHGEGYNSEPKVSWEGGGGKGLEMKAILDKEDGKIKRIDVINNGSGYYDTPKIVVDHPSLNNACYLCCK